jgi:RimJ/RimL family protein N-acetyltransferase
MEIKMKNTIITTDRLIIRKYEEKDLDDLYEYLSDEEVVRFEPYSALSLEETKKNLEWRVSSDEIFAIELKSTGKMIGNVFLGKRECETLELGYVLNRKFWGNGYAFEACYAMCANVFSNGTHRIEANCDPLNSASWKLLEQLGFVREGHLHKDIYFRKDENGNPIWKDTYIYSKLNVEEKL